jgi:hypothetical protein
VKLLAALVLVAALAVPARADAQPRTGCPAPIVAIIRADFGRSWSWAVGIAWRESRCQPGAANRRSSARGLFQMMVPLHARDFAAVGCSWRQWANAWCNAGAAAHLYRSAGSRPWR